MSSSNGLPAVSIVTPAYNSARTVSETIASVMAQTFENWELLIVDDCSTDETVLRIEEAVDGDPRVRLLRNDSRLGASGSRNKAIGLAVGRYIAFLDADDYWHERKLEDQVGFMAANRVGFSYHDYAIVDESGMVLKKVACPPKLNYQQYLRDNRIGVLTIMLDTDVVGKPHMYNQPVAATVGTWLRILKAGHEAHNVIGAQAFYRITPGSLSRNKLRSRFWYWKALTTIVGMNPVSAAYFTVVSSVNAFKKNFVGFRRPQRSDGQSSDRSNVE